MLYFFKLFNINHLASPRGKQVKWGWELLSDTVWALICQCCGPRRLLKRETSQSLRDTSMMGLRAIEWYSVSYELSVLWSVSWETSKSRGQPVPERYRCDGIGLLSDTSVRSDLSVLLSIRRRLVNRETSCPWETCMMGLRAREWYSARSDLWVLWSIRRETCEPRDQPVPEIYRCDGAEG